MAQLSANSASLAGTYYQPDWSPAVTVGNYNIPAPQGYAIGGGGTYQPQVKGTSTFNPVPTLGNTQLGPNLPAGRNTGGNGGGGGGGGGAPSPYRDPSTGMTFNSQGDFMNEVGNVFGGANDVLNQQEQRVRAGEQDLYTQAQAPYNSALPLLEQAKTDNLNRNASQVGDVRQQESSALDAARNLYNELRQGSQQRFGGSSSAGEFAYNLLGREQQRNFGDVQKTTGANIQKLQQQATDIVTGYQTKLQELNTQKEAALAQARDVFRQQLSQIDSARFGLEQNKAQAKLQALYQLRSDAQSIQQQFTQFQQQLALNSQQAYLQATGGITDYAKQMGQPVATDQYGNPQYSAFGGQQGGQQGGGFQGGITKKGQYDPATGQYMA